MLNLKQSKKIIEYYSQSKVLREMLDSVTNPQWRVWKCMDCDTSIMRQSRKMINSEVDLLKFILNMKWKEVNGKYMFTPTSIPDKVYVSVAKFLNPEKVFGRHPTSSRYVVADSLFMGSELFFDFDSEDNLKLAWQDAKTVYNYMKEQVGYKFIRCTWSGKKGFHLLYKDTTKYENISSPIAKLNFIEKVRGRIINGLPKLNTIDDMHRKIFVDQFRVYAVKGSIKASTGYKVQEIDIHQLESGESFKRQIKRLARPLKPMTRTVHKGSIKDINTGEGPSLTSPFSYYFLDNIVKGLKDKYITVLRYNKGTPVDKKIESIQQVYQLPDFYQIQYKDSYYYICMKIVDKQRLTKIMKASKCDNLRGFLFYGHTWLPISETVKEYDKAVCGRPKLVKVFKSKYGLTHTQSKYHLKALFGREVDNSAGDDFDIKQVPIAVIGTKGKVKA